MTEPKSVSVDVDRITAAIDAMRVPASSHHTPSNDWISVGVVKSILRGDHPILVTSAVGRTGMSSQACGWCDGLRISCEVGLCDVYPPHDCPATDAGRPLTAEESAVGFWAMHEECRPKFAETLSDLRTKGVSIVVGGIEVHP